MKKSILTTAALISMFMGIHCAAQDSIPLYIGAEGHLKSLKSKISEGSSTVPLGLGLSAGLKFCDYVGIEVGAHLAKKKKDGFKYDHKGISAQVMGYIPFDAFSLVAGLGMTHVHIRQKDVTDGEVVKDSRPLPKASIGFMIHHTDNISSRYMASWEKSSKLGKQHEWELKDSLHHQLGVVYTF